MPGVPVNFFAPIFSFCSNTAGPVLRCACWLLLLTTASQASAGNTYRYQGSDGTVVFSDVRAGSARSRQYKAAADSSRPPARVSCSGQLEKRLTDPKTHIQASINHFARKYGVNPHLVKAVARIESCFDTRAVSSAGAKGLMQLMPATAAQYGVFDLFDVNKNIETGVRYLAGLIRQFEYNEKFALAAYNAGPGAVAQYKGIPPYPETRVYVKKVLNKYREYTLSSEQ